VLPFMPLAPDACRVMSWEFKSSWPAVDPRLCARIHAGIQRQNVWRADFDIAAVAALCTTMTVI